MTSAHHDGREAAIVAALQLRDQLMCRGGLLAPARAYLDGDAAGTQLGGHGVHNLEKPVGLGHQRRAAAPVADQVDGAGGVQVHELGLDLILEDLK